MNVEGLGLTRRVRGLLAAHGIDSVEALIAFNARELLHLDRVGEGAVREIAEALAGAGLSLAEDPYAPHICVREGKPRGDARLANFFLCDGCARRWADEAFDGEPPVYAGSEVDGFCCYCNAWSQHVRLFQWFLCGVCERVLRSIGRSLVSAQAFANNWDDQIAPQVPHLYLREIDAPSPRRRTRVLIQEKVATVDFEVSERRSDEAVFGIELKTGTSHIGRGGVGSSLAVFQLDTSDCDDITTVVERDQLPVYLVHSQVVDIAEPPTTRYVAIEGWWTDLLSMEEGFLRVQMRPRETRTAAYFDPAIFRPLAELATHLQSREPEAIRRELRRRRWRPQLYEQ